MAFPRAAVMRSCFRDLRHAAVLPRVFPSIARRGYASDGRNPNYGGDALWAAGAIAVTIPSCWYLLSNRSHQSHHNHDHDESQEVSNHEEEKSEELNKASDQSDDAGLKEKEEDKPTSPERMENTIQDDDTHDSGSQFNTNNIEKGDAEEKATVSEPSDDSGSHNQ